MADSVLRTAGREEPGQAVPSEARPTYSEARATYSEAGAVYGEARAQRGPVRRLTHLSKTD